MINHNAIRQLYPEAVTIVSNATGPQTGFDNFGRANFDLSPIAYDAEGNVVNYDKDLVTSLTKKIECKSQAKQLLVNTDWSALPDVGLVNAEEFIAYRAAIRSLMITPIEEPAWPVTPTAVWN